MPLSIFGFQAMWSPVMIGVIVFLTILYFLITVKWRNDFKVSEPLKMRGCLFFSRYCTFIYCKRFSSGFNGTYYVLISYGPDGTFTIINSAAFNERDTMVGMESCHRITCGT